ncbi:MAG TPA: phage holin family protein [Actinomycetes bacterium]|nr:phage holin family protein [Actinomycetes bacterium]
MRTFLVRLLVNAVALWVAAIVVSGVTLAEGATTSNKIITVLLVALVFGLVNALIKPFVKLLALPLFILTLGLITFVINALMLMLTSWISGGVDLAFHVDGFGAALLGALVISIVSFVLNVLVPDHP